LIAAAKLFRRFEILASQWERQTRNLSSLTAISEHAAYREIIRMGEDVLPLILSRMQSRPRFWFEALRQIAGPENDPVTPKMYGNVQRMTDAWVKWGTERGHL
jgi:hypothetical protein